VEAHVAKEVSSFDSGALAVSPPGRSRWAHRRVRPWGHGPYSQFLDDGEIAAATKLLDHGDMDIKSAIMPVNAVADARKDIPRDGAGLIR
jgi:hypothetical protein